MDKVGRIDILPAADVQRIYYRTVAYRNNAVDEVKGTNRRQGFHGEGRIDVFVVRGFAKVVVSQVGDRRMPSTNRAHAMIRLADTAIRARGVLQLYYARKENLPQGRQILDGVVNLLETAREGGELLTGKACSSAFSGDLAPITWVINSYQGLQNKSTNPPDYREINDFLGDRIKDLNLIAGNLSADEPMAELSHENWQTTLDFLRQLGNVLTADVDASTRKVSRPVTV